MIPVGVATFFCIYDYDLVILRALGKCRGRLLISITKSFMKETIDLNAELREFLRMRVTQILGEEQENRDMLKLSIKEAGDDIFCLLYEYQVDRGWEQIAENMARMTGIERSTTYKIRGRIRKSKR